MYSLIEDETCLKHFRKWMGTTCLTKEWSGQTYVSFGDFAIA